MLSMFLSMYVRVCRLATMPSSVSPGHTRGARIADHRQGVCPGVAAPSQTTGDHRRQRQAQVELEHTPTAQKAKGEVLAPRGRCRRAEGR